MNARQRRAAAHLARGLGPTETARRVGVTPRAIRYWRDDPDFVAACAPSQAKPVTAHETLEDLLNSSDERTRLQAAVALARGQADGTLPTGEDEGPRVRIFHSPEPASA